MQAQKGWPFPFPALADITISPDVRFARQKLSSTRLLLRESVSSKKPYLGSQGSLVTRFAVLF
jgi:hypothetical protein